MAEFDGYGVAAVLTADTAVDLVVGTLAELDGSLLRDSQNAPIKSV